MGISLFLIHLYLSLSPSLCASVSLCVWVFVSGYLCLGTHSRSLYLGTHSCSLAFLLSRTHFVSEYTFLLSRTRAHVPRHTLLLSHILALYPETHSLRACARARAHALSLSFGLSLSSGLSLFLPNPTLTQIEEVSFSHARVTQHIQKCGKHSMGLSAAARDLYTLTYFYTKENYFHTKETYPHTKEKGVEHDGWSKLLRQETYIHSPIFTQK